MISPDAESTLAEVTEVGETILAEVRGVAKQLNAVKEGQTRTDKRLSAIESEIASIKTHLNGRR